MGIVIEIRYKKMTGVHRGSRRWFGYQQPIGDSLSLVFVLTSPVILFGAGDGAVDQRPVGFFLPV